MDNAFKIPKENDSQHRIKFIGKSRRKNLFRHENFFEVSLSYILFQKLLKDAIPQNESLIKESILEMG